MSRQEQQTYRGAAINTKIFFVIGLMLILLSMALVFTFFKEIFISRELKQHGSLIKSEIIGVELNKISNPPDRIYIFKVKHNGIERSIRYTDYTTNSDRFRIGDSVSVYFSEKLDKLRIKEDLEVIPIRNLLFSIFLALIGACLIIYRTNISKAIKKGQIKLGD